MELAMKAVKKSMEAWIDNQIESSSRVRDLLVGRLEKDKETGKLVKKSLASGRQREFPVFSLPKFFGFLQNLPDFGKASVDVPQFVINLLALLCRGHAVLKTCFPRLKLTISIAGQDTTMLDTHRLWPFPA
jgi:hypothetical protein